MDKNAKIDFLKKLPMFVSLNEMELAQLADCAQFRSAPRYHFVFVPDEARMMAIWRLLAKKCAASLRKACTTAPIIWLSSWQILKN